MKNKILGLCGSLRKESWNLKLLKNFVEGMENATVYPSLEMPLVNEDLETKPLDMRIQAFRAALSAAPIVVIACPEYNSSITPALKNAIDWGTRGENLWANKIVVLLSASPGALGGARGLIHVRAILSNIKAWVIPELVQLPHANAAFNENGKLTVEFVQKQIVGAKESLENFAKKML